MITGKTKKENFINIDYIFDHTNGGHDVFKYYLGSVNKIMSRPWGKRENKLSWGIFVKNNIWYYKDFASEEVGNCIQFVEKYFSLSFKEAIAKISSDFNVKENSNFLKKSTPAAKQEKNYSPIGVITQPFQERHHNFWNLLEVNEEHCKKMNCFAIKKLAINYKNIPIRSNEIVFGYWSEEEKGWKIYFPDRSKDKRFRNNVSGHYLWNYNNVKYCDDLIIQKSNKDLIVTTMITPCVISTQNESSAIFDSEIVKKINKITKTPWVWYGSDPDGVDKCIKITGTNKWKYINTPKEMLPTVNDAAEFVKYYNLIKKGTGLKKLEEFMRSKKLLK